MRLFKNTLLMVIGIVFYFGFNKEEKPLSQVAMVAKFLDPDKPWSFMTWQQKKKAHTFLPSFDNANSRLSKEIVESQKFCCHGNVTSHFSSLLISLFKKHRNFEYIVFFTNSFS